MGQNAFMAWIGVTRERFDASFSSFSESIADLIFPKEAIVAEMEMMSVVEFARKAKGVEEMTKIASPKSLKSYNGAKNEVISLFNYRNEYIRAAIWQLKYKKNAAIARLLAEFLFAELARIAQHLEEMKGGIIKDANKAEAIEILLIPVPISAERRKERGYNQIEMLLEETMNIAVRENTMSRKIRHGKREDISADLIIRNDLLIKTRNTPPQTSAEDRAERLENLRGCFAVARPEGVAGKIIVVIDDVLTTGSTLCEARKTLLEAGAKKVFCLTLAH